MAVLLSVAGANIIIVLTCAGGLIYAIINYMILRKVQLNTTSESNSKLLSEDSQKVNLMVNIAEAISKVFSFH
jgi:hypothetical protein